LMFTHEGTTSEKCRETLSGYRRKSKEFWNADVSDTYNCFGRVL